MFTHEKFKNNRDLKLITKTFLFTKECFLSNPIILSLLFTILFELNFYELFSRIILQIDRESAATRKQSNPQHSLNRQASITLQNRLKRNRGSFLLTIFTCFVLPVPETRRAPIFPTGGDEWSASSSPPRYQD